ncbi:MAG: hypothetical protein COA97_05325 [Flavobacteriales bacterium]|nr:MAG: hypothetical protein COA97_05325 [Flavobacteriales bacterium]
MFFNLVLNLKEFVSILMNPKIHSVIQFVISLLWIYENGHRLYNQHYGGVMYLIMFPDWWLFMNISFGSFGMFVALWVFYEKMKIGKGYLFIFLALLISLIFPVILD